MKVIKLFIKIKKDKHKLIREVMQNYKRKIIINRYYAISGLEHVLNNLKLHDLIFYL